MKMGIPRHSGPSGSIAFYLPHLKMGGAERTVLRLAAAFRTRGRAVHLVLDQAVGELVAEADGLGLPVEDLGAGRAITALPRLAGWLRRRRPAALISAISHNNVIAVWARAMAGVDTRIIVGEHSVASLQAMSEPSWQHRIMPLLARLVYPRADAIVAVSDSAADALAESAHLPRRLITVIPNPVVDEGFASRAALPAPHQWLAGDGPPVIVAAGRLVPLKDFATLIRAFAVVAGRRPARLLILGEGPCRGELERLIDESGLRDVVHLPGNVPDVAPYFARAAAVVMSSRYEGFGLVLVEAMACGTPVVSTDCPGGPRELLEDGRLGPLVPVGDADGLAEAILDTLDSPPPAPALRARASKYGVAASADRYLDLCDSLRDIRPTIHSVARTG